MAIEIKNENIGMIVIGIAILLVVIIIFTELSTMTALIFIGSIIAGAVGIIRLQKTGKLRPTGTLITQYKNNLALKRIRNPRMRQLSPEEYKDFKESQRKNKWKINW